MSGGSYDYAYSKVEDMAHALKCSTKERIAFKRLLELVAKAMHDIEWNDSCDGADEQKSLKAVFGFLTKDADAIAKARSFDDIRERLKDLLGCEQGGELPRA